MDIKARVINVYTFTKKETGDVYARMTYSIPVERTNNFCGSAIVECFIPVELVGKISEYIDKIVNLKVENVPGQNHQLVARLVQIDNVNLKK